MSVRAIARLLAISPTAVSLALKDSPRVSPRLKDRIREQARALGYIPNAKLAELMGEVRRSSVPVYRATLGAFSFYPAEAPWCERPYLKHLFDGAVKCAASHGYKLEYLWYLRPGMTPMRFRKILETRGIQGLFCLGSLEPDQSFPPELRKFAVTTFSVSVPGPLHRVSSHFTYDARLLFDELLRRGYRRPGLCILVHGDRRTDYAYSATYLSTSERHLSPPHPPVLRADTWDEASFHHWFTAHRPDVIVLHQFPAYIAGVEAYLKTARLRVPRDIGLALLDLNPDRLRYSGICQNTSLMGATAIELLIGRILMRDFQAPAHPKVELVIGEWNEGRTLRSIAK
ncbi:MAG: LacI family DNA-binding transcriptional regulator [Undibacterium sp.]|nr:LacI family DNA-binding transcriptional regulator [Opitutaceae bacterium]